MSIYVINQGAPDGHDAPDAPDAPVMDALFIYFYLRKIVAQGGILGLWRGCWPNVQVKEM